MRRSVDQWISDQRVHEFMKGHVTTVDSDIDCMRSAGCVALDQLIDQLIT
jgi:hypothetical protein